MILHTPRSRVAHAFDAFLTFLAWIGFGYLIGSGVIAMMEGDLGGPGVPLWSKVLPTFHTLLIYVVAAIFNGAVLVAWARYNRVRYGGLDRRKPCGQLTDLRKSLAFCASSTQLAQLQSCRVGVVHHDAEGMITAVEAPAARLFVVPGAA